MHEPSRNVYEKKGPGFHSLAQSCNVVEKKTLTSLERECC